MKIGLLSNLNAGRTGTRISRLLDLLSSHPEVAHVETNHAGALPEALDALADQGVDLLVTNGGDGTLQQVLTEILEDGPFERLPLIAPLRGGRTNMTALDLGCRRDPVRGLAQLIEAVRDGTLDQQLVNRSMLRVSFDAGRRVEYGAFFGAGIIPRAIAEVHRLFPSGRSQGVFGAGVMTASLVSKIALGGNTGIMRPDKIDARVDGEELAHSEFTLLMATTLDRLFLGLNPFWGSGPGGVRFTAVSATAEHFGRRAPRVAWGRPGHQLHAGAGYSSHNATQVTLRLDSDFTVDGEIFSAAAGAVIELSADHRLKFVRT